MPDAKLVVSHDVHPLLFPYHNNNITEEETFYLALYQTFSSSKM